MDDLILLFQLGNDAEGTMCGGHHDIFGDERPATDVPKLATDVLEQGRYECAFTRPGCDATDNLGLNAAQHRSLEWSGLAASRESNQT